MRLKSRESRFRKRALELEISAPAPDGVSPGPQRDPPFDGEEKSARRV